MQLLKCLVEKCKISYSWALTAKSINLSSQVDDDDDVMIDVTSNNCNVVYELGLEETVATLLKLLHLSIGLGATTFNLLRSRQ